MCHSNELHNSFETGDHLRTIELHVCHSSEKHSLFETGDHLKTFGAALEPAPQGFEENEKVSEPLGETANSEGDLCSYGGFGGHDIQDNKVP